MIQIKKFTIKRAIENFLKSRIPVLFVMLITALIVIGIWAGLNLSIPLQQLGPLCVSTMAAVSMLSFAFFPYIIITLKPSDTPQDYNSITMWIDGRRFEYDKNSLPLQEKVILWRKGIYEIIVCCNYCDSSGNSPNKILKEDRIEVWSRRCQSKTIALNKEESKRETEKD